MGITSHNFEDPKPRVRASRLLSTVIGKCWAIREELQRDSVCPPCFRRDNVTLHTVDYASGPPCALDFCSDDQRCASSYAYFVSGESSMVGNPMSPSPDEPSQRSLFS